MAKDLDTKSGQVVIFWFAVCSYEGAIIAGMWFKWCYSLNLIAVVEHNDQQYIYLIPFTKHNHNWLSYSELYLDHAFWLTIQYWWSVLYDRLLKYRYRDEHRIIVIWLYVHEQRIVSMIATVGILPSFFIRVLFFI